MIPIDKKLEKDMKEGKVPKPIEDLPSEWAKEDREIEGAKPDLAETAGIHRTRRPPVSRSSDAPDRTATEVRFLRLRNEGRVSSSEGSWR